MKVVFVGLCVQTLSLHRETTNTPRLLVEPLESYANAIVKLLRNLAHAIITANFTAALFKFVDLYYYN